MKSFTTIQLQYAHRFYGFKGEAQYLHGHTGILTIEVADTIENGVNMVFPCNEIYKTAWEVLQNFDHALILREDDPLLPAVLKVYDEQGIRARRTDKRNFLACFRRDADVPQYRMRFVIPKINVIEHYIAFEFRQRNGTVAVRMFPCPHSRLFSAFFERAVCG